MSLSPHRPDVDVRLLDRGAAPGRVRGIAVDTLQRVLAEPTRASGILRQSLRAARALHSRERRFVADALYDSMRYGVWLDAAMGLHSPDALARWLGWLVHLGAEADTARAGWREERGERAPAFERCADLAAVAADAPGDALTLMAGVSADGASRLRARFGDQVTRFVHASNERAPTVVRLDRRRSRRDQVLARLAAEGVPAEATPLAPDGVSFPPRTHLPGLTSLGAGWELQDEASQLVAAVVDPGPSDAVLDYCAGAGGKTLAIGCMLSERARLVATDVRSRALGELKRRARKADLRVHTAVLDERGRPSADLHGPFDRVLVDAPCSGSGVWRRHPENRIRLGMLAHLNALQDHVLAAAAEHVRPGGRLIYATCSVLEEENEHRVRAFLQQHPEFSVLPLRLVLDPGVAERVSRGAYLATTPHEHGVDGFFAAVLERMG